MKVPAPVEGSLPDPESVVRCAWCGVVATGWAEHPSSPEVWFPSCGSYPERTTGFTARGYPHGYNFRPNTVRHCEWCRTLLPEWKTRDTRFCNSVCMKAQHRYDGKIHPEVDMKLLESRERAASASRSYRRRQAAKILGTSSYE